MTMLSVDKEGRINLEAINNEDYLNDLPEELKCEVCGRPISELEPFGGPGDPLMGNYEGELLVKVWRREGPFIEGYAEAWKAGEESGEDLLDWEWFLREFGHKKGMEIAGAYSRYNSIEPAWECRDCAAMSDEECSQALEEKWEAEMRKSRKAG